MNHPTGSPSVFIIVRFELSRWGLGTCIRSWKLTTPHILNDKWATCIPRLKQKIQSDSTDWSTSIESRNSPSAMWFKADFPPLLPACTSFWGPVNVNESSAPLRWFLCQRKKSTTVWAITQDKTNLKQPSPWQAFHRRCQGSQLHLVRNDLAHVSVIFRCHTSGKKRLLQNFECPMANEPFAILPMTAVPPLIPACNNCLGTAKGQRIVCHPPKIRWADRHWISWI